MGSRIEAFRALWTIGMGDHDPGTAPVGIVHSGGISPEPGGSPASFQEVPRVPSPLMVRIRWSPQSARHSFAPDTVPEGQPVRPCRGVRVESQEG